MVISKRTKASLCQLLCLLEKGDIFVLFQKYDFQDMGSCEHPQLILRSLTNASDNCIESLIDELVRTSNSLRQKITPRYTFDEYWDDFKKCLMLDGYKVENANKLVKIEPTIDGVESMDDDLIDLLRQSSFDEVINNINLSAEHFQKASPDYNACLTHARIALETIERTIASHKGYLSGDSTKKEWGNSLGYLEKNSFITKKEEEAISSIYSLVSEGCHNLIGFSEEEFARFGRNLAISMCYFLIKKFKQNNNSRNFPPRPPSISRTL